MANYAISIQLVRSALIKRSQQFLIFVLVVTSPQQLLRVERQQPVLEIREKAKAANISVQRMAYE